MNGMAFLLAAILGAVPVDATLLDGSRVSGQLTTLSADAAEIQGEGESRKIAPTDLLQIEFGPKGEPALPAMHAEIRLADGARLYGANLAVAAGDATFQSPSLGKVTLPAASILDIRFGELTGVGTAWDELRATESQNDRVIIRKGDALDFVAGVIGGIADSQITIVIAGQEAKVPASRVFAILYASRKTKVPAPVCDVLFRNGERAPAAKLTLENDSLAIATTGGVSAKVPAAQVSSADYGLGKIRSLADVPRQASYDKVNPLWTEEDQARLQPLRIDHVPWGRTQPTPLRVGGKTYGRGIWFHSGTTVRFQLDRQFRKLQATAGIDENPAGRERVQPKVRLAITGDGKSLFDKVIAWNDAEIPLDLDVAGVRTLELQVTPAEKSPFYGACEHLDLVDAKLIK